MARRRKRRNADPTATAGPRRPVDLFRAAKEIEGQRRKLANAAEVAHVTASLFHQWYDFDSDEPDLGYLCQLVNQLLEGVAGALMSCASAQEPDPGALATAVETQRQQLFRALAVARAMAYYARDRRFPERQADPSKVFAALDDTCEHALVALDPVSLGLPVPVSSAALEQQAALRG